MYLDYALYILISRESKAFQNIIFKKLRNVVIIDLNKNLNSWLHL